MLTTEERIKNNEIADREFIDANNKKFPSIKFPSFIKEEELDDEFSWRKDYNNLVFGDYILFQIVGKGDENNSIMSYPKLALFANYNIADQALQYDMVLPIRTWEYRFKPSVGYLDRTTNIYVHFDWDETIYIFGKWKSFPTWKEMKQAYKKTFYFREDRKQKISRILNSEI